MYTVLRLPSSPSMSSLYGINKWSITILFERRKQNKQKMKKNTSDRIAAKTRRKRNGKKILKTIANKECPVWRKINKRKKREKQVRDIYHLLFSRAFQFLFIFSFPHLSAAHTGREGNGNPIRVRRTRNVKAEFYPTIPSARETRGFRAGV